MASDEYDKIRKASELLKEVSNTTNCGYCKEIMADYAEGLDTYLNIVDKTQLLSEIKSREGSFLNKVNDRATELVKSSYQTEHVDKDDVKERPHGRRPMDRLSNGGLLGIRPGIMTDIKQKRPRLIESITNDLFK